MPVERPVKYCRFEGLWEDEFILQYNENLNFNTSNGSDSVVIKDPMIVSYG